MYYITCDKQSKKKSHHVFVTDCGWIRTTKHHTEKLKSYKSFNSHAAANTILTFKGQGVKHWFSNIVCETRVFLRRVCVCVCWYGIFFHCHTFTNVPPTFAFKSSYSGNVLSGLSMVASDTRKLTGRPKLLYLQRTASPWIIQDVPSIWRQGSKGGSGLLLAGQARKHKIDTSIVRGSVKQRECRAGYSKTKWFMETSWMLWLHLPQHPKDH